VIPMGDLCLTHLSPKDEHCKYCGDKAKVVIMNPNTFPDNNYYDNWDVCEGCREYINLQINIDFMKHMKNIDNQPIYMSRKFNFRGEENDGDGNGK